jgi:hypothetical protein
MSGSGGRPRGPLQPARRSWGGPGSNGGRAWRGVRQGRRGPTLRPNLQNTTIERDHADRAVSCVPYMRSTARSRRIGSIVELCMLGAPRPVPGTTTPPQVPAVEPLVGAAPPRGTTPPTSRCPPSPSAGSQPFKGARPPGTDARRNRPQGRRAQRGPKSSIPGFATLAAGGLSSADFGLAAGATCQTGA